MKAKVKMSKQQIIGLVIVAVLLIAILIFPINKYIGDRGIVPIILYILGTKLVILGSAAMSGKIIQNLTIPSIVAFIPYAQIVMLTKSKIQIIGYFTSLILTISMPILMASQAILSLVPVEKMASYSGTVTLVTLVFFVIWRVLHMIILGNALLTFEQYLDENIAERPAWNAVLDKVKALTFLFPVISLWGSVSLMLAGTKLENYKKSVLIKKHKSFNA